ncbi:MAG: alpha-glucuronidase [Cyclobacteriaceae bacterium]|nr:alpha-glucuronidase [Cyclobacteriaceae bacterium]
MKLSVVMIRTLLFFLILCSIIRSKAEDGYRLWLRYERITNVSLLKNYTRQLTSVHIGKLSPTIQVAVEELQLAIKSMLVKELALTAQVQSGTLLLGTPASTPVIRAMNISEKLRNTGPEGYLIMSTAWNGKKVIVITANTDKGVLYGVFHFIRLIQTQQDISDLNISSAPKIKLRLLNHWDNLDRTVERGYAGFSIWDWHKLPDFIDPRYKDYARANASIGINGTVLTNVNANAWVLTPQYLEKVAALANVFRPYGIRVYLTARFSAPTEIGGLPTADPLNPDVQQWWNKKVREIYNLIPDFGGFLVKANSEGQPGPQNFGRTHAEGANMLARALAPFNGVVMWRAFVYDDKIPDDRAKQAFNEFKPLDGAFLPNVLVQVKNGPIDFQPREPFHPLFGAMPATPLMMEFQITQEYTGFSTHLVYLANQFKECLSSDTYARGEGSTVARVIDGSLHNYPITGMAGVANIGTDRNWTGHHFGQANWYAFGRLAWNHELTAMSVAEEWIRMTFTNELHVVNTIKKLMDSSWETTVNYMTPLGLHHIMGWNHHYGPAPWIQDKHRADWTSVYYHRADEKGLGFDRTPSGSNAVSQYTQRVSEKFGSRLNCPEKFLLWFHHVGWTEQLSSGKTLWEELCLAYYRGAAEVKQMLETWSTLQGKIDDDRYEHVRTMLSIQHKEAIWWRNACVLYFQTFSKMEIPAHLEKPDKPLSYYMQLEFPYAPGIKPKW